MDDVLRVEVFEPPGDVSQQRENEVQVRGIVAAAVQQIVVKCLKGIGGGVPAAERGEASRLVWSD